MHSFSSSNGNTSVNRERNAKSFIHEKRRDKKNTSGLRFTGYFKVEQLQVCMKVVRKFSILAFNFRPTFIIDRKYFSIKLKNYCFNTQK